MSEYQYYEFRTIDRPLTQHEMGELRTLSSRATIMPTSFTNTYNFGSFKGDPSDLVEKYFDAFVYVSNWGTRRLLLRVPRRLIDMEAIAPFAGREGLSFKPKGGNLIVSFHSNNEEPENWEEGEGWLPSLLPLREELMKGDIRGLYLGWLLCAQAGELKEDFAVPPIPSGLQDLSGSLDCLANFLRINPSLVEISGELNPAKAQAMPSFAELKTWVDSFSPLEQKKFLVDFILGQDTHLRQELIQRYNKVKGQSIIGKSPEKYTVGLLLSASEERTKKKEAEAREARTKKKAENRAKHVADLSEREDAVWQETEALINKKKATAYKEAVSRLQDLRELSRNRDQGTSFAIRISQILSRHKAKTSFVRQLNEAGLVSFMSPSM